MQPACSVCQWLGKASKLTHSAARKKRDDLRPGIQTEPCPGRVAVDSHRDFIGQWMAHVPNRNRTRTIDGRLEWKQREHHVHGPCNLVESVAPPCPYRWTDEMNGFHTGAA